MVVFMVVLGWRVITTFLGKLGKNFVKGFRKSKFLDRGYKVSPEDARRGART